MIRVMCFGTFDILHPGHVAFLTKARKLGDELYVVVSRDARRRALSGKTPIHTQKERMLVLAALRSVTRVLAGHATDPLFQIKKIKPAVIVLGHDQVFGVDAVEAWAGKQKRPPHIVHMKAINRVRYSTTRIKSDLCNNNLRNA